MSVKYTPATQSTLCSIFLMCVAAMHRLKYSWQELKKQQQQQQNTHTHKKKKQKRSLRFWHTCDLEIRSRPSNLEWIAKLQARL